MPGMPWRLARCCTHGRGPSPDEIWHIDTPVIRKNSFRTKNGGYRGCWPPQPSSEKPEVRADGRPPTFGRDPEAGGRSAAEGGPLLSWR